MKLYYPNYHDECMEESPAGTYYLASDVAKLQADYDHEKVMRQQAEARIAELENELRITKNAESDLRAFVHLLRPHIESAAKAFGLTS